jgi:peptide/nickel transport system permease protein
VELWGLDFGDIWQRFRKSKTALFGMGIALLVIAISILAPVVSPYNPRTTSSKSLDPPSAEHWFGTDLLGRDVLSRVLWGTRPSLIIGLVTSLVASFVGLVIGAIAGYYGGLVDFSFMRITEMFLVIPSYFFYILVVATLRSRELLTMATIMALLMWPKVARVVRSEYLSLREKEYVMAAKALGIRNINIVFRHLLPNVMASVIVLTTMNIAASILIYSGLGFIGLTDPTLIEWGAILADGRDVLMYGGWWITTFPGLMIFLTVLGFNFIGDGLRDAMDPRLRGTI